MKSPSDRTCFPCFLCLSFLIHPGGSVLSENLSTFGRCAGRRPILPGPWCASGCGGPGGPGPPAAAAAAREEEAVEVVEELPLWWRRAEDDEGDEEESSANIRKRRRDEGKVGAQTFRPNKEERKVRVFPQKD